MSDEETIATDGLGLEETAEETPSGESQEPAETPEGEGEQLELEASAIEGEGETSDEQVESEEETPAYKPNLKFRVMDKEHEIPKEFEAMMTDEKSEKMVRELHEKALGLDVVKQKFNETREERNGLATELAGIKNGIDGLKGIVQGAMKSGNLLKLDDFFQRLNIPQETIMKYALSKVQFSNLPPEQQQMIQANMDAERRQQDLEAQNQGFQSDIQRQATELKRQQLDYALARDEYREVAEAWDTKSGKPGSFRQLVAQTGYLAWLQSGQTVDMSPEEAIKQVITGFGLQTSTPASPGAAASVAGNTAATTPPSQRIIQRETRTIPNIQGRSSSPLKTKPKSIEDLKKLHAQMVESERGA